MAVEFQVETLDGLDDSLKTAYVEKDGKFLLDPDKYAEFKAAGLKNKNKELLGKLKEKDTKLGRYAKLEEFEDDEIESLLQLKEKSGENGNGAGTGQAAEEITKLQKQHEKALAKIASEKAAIEKLASDLSTENRYYKLTVPLRDIAVKAGVIAADLDLVMLDTAKRFTLSEDSKKIVVLDEEGDPTDVTPQKFFETLYKEQRPKFYQPSGSQGSGAPPNSGGGSGGMKVITRAQYDAMDHPTRAQIDWKTTKITD